MNNGNCLSLKFQTIEGVYWTSEPELLNAVINLSSFIAENTKEKIKMSFKIKYKYRNKPTISSLIIFSSLRRSLLLAQDPVMENSQSMQTPTPEVQALLDQPAH